VVVQHICKVNRPKTTIPYFLFTLTILHHIHPLRYSLNQAVPPQPTQPCRCALYQTTCGQHVVIKDLLRFELLPGESYNLLSNSATVTPIRISIDGRNPAFYTPTSPY
jgi:hypothetical protein